MSKKYSILVPVYNVENYIRDCIESVLTQTYRNFELLLVDDGSQDRSGEICDEYSQKDSRIRVFHKNNQGLIHTRRFAIERATGDYLVFLDSDDMIKKNALEVINAKIHEYDCDCLIYGFEKIEDGRVISKEFDRKEEILYKRIDIYRKVLLSTAYNSLCRKAVRASVFQNNGIDYSRYYHLYYSEDLLQSLEIYKHSRTIAFVPDILYSYRMNPQSITHKKRPIDYTIRKRVWAFLKNEEVFDEVDNNRYKDFCIYLFCGDLMYILLSYESFNKKVNTLSKMSKDSYYQEFISQGITNWKSIGGIRTVLYVLFRWKCYSLIVVTSNVVLAIKKAVKNLCAFACDRSENHTTKGFDRELFL